MEDELDEDFTLKPKKRLKSQESLGDDDLGDDNMDLLDRFGHLITKISYLDLPKKFLKLW